MEGFLVSAATGALKAVTVKLATLIGDEFKHMKDVNKDIKPLSDELKYMHAFLEKMSEEENPDNQDKIWMTEVREMSYDMEDSIDDFMICINDYDRFSKKKGLMERCKKLLEKMKSHKRISKAIQEFKSQIKEVGDRNHRYRTGVTNTKNSHEMVDFRAHAIFKDVSELVGIDDQKNYLINLLTRDGSSSQHQTKVVSIVGLGGLGKTTLANQVYESLKDKFDCHSLVTVSRTPHMMEVLRTILSDVSSQKYNDTEVGDAQHLIRKISDFLHDKRYLIVVDDLWDIGSWETIENAFIKNSCASRIITTTRKIDVAESCCSSRQGHIYKLSPLNLENSRKLFLKRIFGLEEGCPSYLIEVCEDILKKCDGLPLAIIAIAGLLAGKAPTIYEWNKVHCSIGHALERQSDINRMKQILSLSYFDLPPHLQSCLLYLSIFPEDYKIGKHRLILRWIAEGFIHEEHGFTQYELGERCLNELINRSLIEPAERDFHGVHSCRVYDTILEFILSKAVEENFITLVGVFNIAVNPHMRIRRLSLQDRKNEVPDALVDSQEKIIYYQARAISVFSANLDILPSLEGFRHVRVLDLEGCKGLEAHHLAHLGRLFALRYLSLHNTDIRELPEEIGELQYLQTLNVFRTEIKEMLSSVDRLTRLFALFCGYHVKLPDGFGKSMQALQWLGCIDVSIQSPSFAEELCQLRNLQILDLIIDDELSNNLASSLVTLGTRCLSSLTINYNNKNQKKLTVEPWNPTQLDLKKLKIWLFVFPRIPVWIGSLVNLQELTIFVEQVGVAEFGLLGSLNALSSLLLFVNVEVANRSSICHGTQRLKVNGTHGFPSLRRFLVGSTGCALGLLFEARAMSKLQDLRLDFDEYKTGTLTDGDFDFGIQHLPCLALITCCIIHFKQNGPEQPVLDGLNKAVSSNLNHPQLSLVTGWRWRGRNRA